MKRVFWILITPAIGIFLLSLLVEHLIFPKVSDWGLNYARNIFKQAHLELKVGSTQLRLFRLSVFLKEIKVEGEIPGVPDGITIDQLQVRVDPLGLLLGQVRLSALVLDGAAIRLDLDKLERNDSPFVLPIKDIFRWTDKVPLDRLAVRRSQLNISSRKAKWDAQIKPFDALLTNNITGLALRIYAPGISITSPNWPEPGGLSVESLMTLEPKKFVIQSAQIMSLGQTLRFQGTFNDPLTLFTKPAGQVEVHFVSDLQPLSEKLKSFLKKQIPEMKGQLRADANLTFEGKEKLAGKIQLETKDVHIAEFDAGSVKATGELENKTMDFSEIVLNHAAGKATLKNSTIKLFDNFEFKTSVNVNALDIQKLFVALDLTRIPVWLETHGELPCHGRIKNFELTCKGEAEAENLHVRSGMAPDKHTIIAIDKGHVTGEFTADLEKISLNTVVQIGEQKGTFAGDVSYEKGFFYKFDASALDFKDIKNLAGLDFKGQLTLQGSTTGNAHTASVEMKAFAKDFFFEKYFLGNLAATVRYENGHLKLQQMDGSLPQSQYVGNVDIDIHDDKLSGAVQFPKVDLRDLAKATEGLYTFPVVVWGSGTGQVEFSGPFDFWKMTYTVKSRFRNGIIHSESFSSFDFNIDSREGLITTRQVEMKKNASTLTVKGTILPDKTAKLNFDGTNWRMEESEFVNKFKSSIVGALNFNATLTGSLKEPELAARGHLAELLIDEQEMPSSFFMVKINKEYLEGQTNFFGNKIQTEFRVPLAENSHHLKLKIKTFEWDFSTALALIGASQLQQEYESQMTSEIDLSSDSGKWDELSGNVGVKTFYLKRGNLWIRNETPIDVRFNKGSIYVRNVVLRGPESEVKMQGEGFSVNNLNLAIDARTDLRLAQLFAPFLDDLGGPFSLQATLTGSYKKPELLGNARIDNGFVKLKTFPHPIEKLRTEVIFSHSKILVQNIRGSLAGGTFRGEGSITINGINDIPTHINIRAEGLNIQFPEKLNSKGDANLVFNGRWFPFVLSGTYNIKAASFEKEFTGNDNLRSQIRESIYLPKALKDISFEPVVLDLQVIIDRNAQVKNSQMDGNVMGQIQIKGSPQSLSMLGKLNIEKGSKLIFKENVFEVQSGTVTFNNAMEINPELFISSQARVADYDVNLSIQGMAKEPVIRLSSVPPLADQEIVSLLALGVTSETLDKSVQSKDQQTRAASEVGAVLLNQFGAKKNIESTLGVDIKITSSFDTSATVNVPKVVFNKKFSRKWNASYSRGMTTDKSNEVKIQYQISNTWSAIGSWEERSLPPGLSVENANAVTENIFGLDLQYRREFR